MEHFLFLQQPLNYPESSDLGPLGSIVQAPRPSYMEPRSMAFKAPLPLESLGSFREPNLRFWLDIALGRLLFIHVK
jgi:hypothetical protein